MASEYRYRLTKRAEEDLEEIIRYLAVELDNPTAATGFMDEFEAAVHQIRVFPESAPRVNNEFLPNANVRKALVKNYVLYYLPNGEQSLIHVLRIVYGRRSMDEILKQLQ